MGVNAGVGYEVVNLLYTTGATVCMTSRSEVSVKNVCRARGFIGLIVAL